MRTPAAKRRAELAEQDVWASSRRILIVDDNRDAPETLGVMFELMGNEIHLANDGEEAVRAAKECQREVR